MLKHVGHALRRNKIRNLFITLIMFVIMAMSCIALSIHTTSNQIRDEQKAKYGSRAYIDLSEDALKSLSNSSTGAASIEFPQLSNDLLVKLTESKILKDTMLETSFSARSDSLKIPEPEHGQMMTSGSVSISSDGDSSMDEEDLATIQVSGYQKDKETSFFSQRNNKIIEGVSPANKDECMIPNTIAELNNLKIGDTIQITSSHYDKKLPKPSEMKLKITGIYQTLPSTNNQMQSFFAQDTIYILNVTALAEAYQNEVYVNASYYLHSPEDLSAFQAEATALGMPDDYEVKTDTAAYESVIAPIDGIAQVAFIFLWIVLALGGSLLVLLTIFNIRERNYEIGILRSLGMKRHSIITQMILEPLCLAALALCLGYGAGMLTAQPISDQLLQQQLDKKEDGTFAGNGAIMISSSALSQETPIDNMELNFDLDVFLQMCAIASFLIFISGGLSALYIVKYEPMQILSERR